MPEEDQATAMCNMHRTFGKDRACSSGDILVDRQTDTRTHTHLDVLNTILLHPLWGQSNYKLTF